MPLFEFECVDCGRDFEKLILKASQTQDLTCPACGSSRLEKKVSAFSSASSSGSEAFSRSNCAPSGG